jgi:hypothetical protein
MLTTFDLDEYVYQALRVGASGFLLKDTPPADLLTAIRVVAAGDALLAPGITRRLIAEFARRPEPSAVTPAELATLTDREREVLGLVAHVLLGYLAGAGWRHIHHLTGRVGLALAGAVRTPCANRPELTWVLVVHLAADTQLSAGGRRRRQPYFVPSSRVQRPQQNRPR